MVKYPKILAAAKKLKSSEQQYEIDQWEFGDALIEECGEPNPIVRGGRTAQDYHDGSRAIFEEVSEFLAGYSLDYSVNYLSQLRNVALNFRGRNRKESLSWSAHREAKTPDNLREILKEDHNPTREFIREQVKVIEGRTLRDLRHQAWVEATEKARRQGVVAPQFKDVKLEPERVPMMVVMSKMEAHIAQVNELLDEMVLIAEDRANEFWPEAVNAIRHDAIRAAESARKLAAVMERATPRKKGGHLAAVGE